MVSETEKQVRPMATGDGCEHSPSCLDCPLRRCKYDDPGLQRRLTCEKRDRALLQAYEKGDTTVSQLAVRFRVSERTVARTLNAAKGGQQ